jgi:hypothetical protein
MLFAFFGLGIPELIILGLLCFVPLVAVAIIVPVVLMASKRSSKEEPKESRDKPDQDGES